MSEALPRLLLPYRERAEAALRRHLDVEGEDGPASVRRAMAHSLFAAGKRVRPILVMLSHEAAGGEAPGIDTVGAAIEMIHTYSLIHDDLPCMDDDDLRRGRPTCHVAFGEALALLAGDALLTRGMALLAEAEGVGPERRARLVALVGEAIGTAGMIGGQVLDLAAEEDPVRSEGALEEIHRRKTGALLAASVLAGAVAAGAAPAAEEGLLLYGRKLGLAFQVVDDLLDVTGSPEEMGKRLRKDEVRGKATFPSLVGVDRSREIARRLAAEAIEALPFDTEAGALGALAQFVVDRIE
ncbi:MAG: polyprenyl synthetase family protein [Candidatus Eisenbacteria bacterium]